MPQPVTREAPASSVGPARWRRWRCWLAGWAWTPRSSSYGARFSLGAEEPSTATLSRSPGNWARGAVLANDFRAAAAPDQIATRHSAGQGRRRPAARGCQSGSDEGFGGRHPGSNSSRGRTHCHRGSTPGPGLGGGGHPRQALPLCQRRAAALWPVVAGAPGSCGNADSLPTLPQEHWRARCSRWRRRSSS